MKEGVTRGRRKRKRRPRGKRKSRQSSVDLKLLHIIRKAGQAKELQCYVIEKVQPDYVNVNETQMRGENKVHESDNLATKTQRASGKKVKTCFKDTMRKTLTPGFREILKETWVV